MYDFLFLSTRITFGTRFNDGIPKYMMPAAHSLALLSACRQIFNETKTLWLQRLLFNFESVESLFDKLSSLPSTILSQIRHLRIRQDSWILSFDDVEHCYTLVWILKLLPGLRLDTLTVLGPLESFDGITNCVALEGLIRYGNGWKELHYLTPDSAMLGFGERAGSYGRQRGGSYRRQPQPSSWKDSLLSRDGIDSKATVVIYQAAEGKVVGAPFTKNNSRPLNQIVVPPDTLETFGLKEDVQLMSDGQRERELLVVVMRGDTDIAERDEGPYDQADIRQQTDGMAWPAIKANLNSNDDDNDDDFQEIETLEADTYKNRDEYVWD